MLCHICYFSATGNSEESVRIIHAKLERAGHEVKIVRINRWMQPFDEIPDLLLLVYPTLAWRPPAMVMRFLTRLPVVTKGKAAILTTDGGGSFGSIEVAERKLKARGYRTVLKAAATYPDNWAQVIPLVTGEERDRKIEQGRVMTDQFAQALLNGTPLPPRRKISLEKLLNFVGLLFVFVGRRFLGKLFVADDDCNACGLCKECCPVGAIVMTGKAESRPFWKFNCESCNRCINTCPKGAINCSLPRGIAMVAVVALVATLGCIGYSTWVRPVYASIAGWAAVLIDIIAYAAVVALSHFVAMAPLDMVIIRPLQQLRPVQRLMQRSYTKSFTKYVCDGYKPPRESRRYGDPEHVG